MQMISSCGGAILLLFMSHCAFAQNNNDDAALDAALGEFFPGSENNCTAPQNCSLTDEELDILLKEYFPPPVEVANISTTTQKPPVTNAVRQQPGQDDCECVIYYQCNNHSIITNGEYLIDIRQPPECDNLMFWCCELPYINKTRTSSVEKPVIPVPAASTCGIRNANGATSFRISDDDDATAQFGEFPWMVALFRMEPGDTYKDVYQCGGSLIHPQVVVTAAHCVSGRAKSVGKPLKIRAGEWDTQNQDEEFPYQERFVRSVAVHPRYNPSTSFNDVALLFLAEPVTIEENVDVVCLPPQNFTVSNVGCYVTGWGQDSFGKSGEQQVILKKVELPIVEHGECEKELRKTRLGKKFQLHSSFICAGGVEGKDVCKGDGGGPLVCPIPGIHGRYHQIGVVSWGSRACGKGVPGVYADLAQHRDWIDSQISKHKFSISCNLVDSVMVCSSAPKRSLSNAVLVHTFCMSLVVAFFRSLLI